tara:strand:- start:141 stop:371 length:231 start_codon:yes stop_codon:yes gene_type:complete
MTKLSHQDSPHKIFWREKPGVYWEPNKSPDTPNQQEELEFKVTTSLCDNSIITDKPGLRTLMNMMWWDWREKLTSS